MARLIKEDDPRAPAVASRAISDGGVVVYPTETLYGLGCLAFDRDACRRIIAMKGRSGTKGLIVLVRDERMLDDHFHIDGETLGRYAATAKPLTLILEPKSRFPQEVSGGRNTVAARISPSPFVRELLRRVGEPVTSTSANMSGGGGSTLIEEVRRDFDGAVDLIVDSGDLPPSAGSAIVNLTADPPEIVRRGDLSEDEIEEFLHG